MTINEGTNDLENLNRFELKRYKISRDTSIENFQNIINNKEILID